MKKRIISLMLVVILTLSCTGYAFAAGAVVTLSSTPESVNPGETFSVTVALSSNPGLSFLKLVISFDSNYLTLENAQKSTEVFDTVTLQKQYKSPFSITCDSEGNSIENGKLAVLTFKVKDNAPENSSYDISCSVDTAFDEKFKDVDVTATGCKISVAPYKDFDEETFGEITLGDEDAELVTDDSGNKSYKYTYDGTEHDLDVNLEEGKTLPAGTTTTIVYSYKDNDGKTVTLEGAPKNAGTYTATATLRCKGYNDKTLTAEIVIDQKTLTVSGMTADNKVYDGTTDAAVSGGELVGVVEYTDETGKVTGKDNVTATFPTKGTFASKNASADPIAVAVDIILGGADAGNYTVQAPKLTAKISKYTVEIKPQDVSKYVGEKDDPTLTFTVNGNGPFTSPAKDIKLVGDDTIDVTLTRDGNGEIGAYKIKVAEATIHQEEKCDNYVIVKSEATFSITKAPLDHIAVTTQPTKTEYIDGEEFVTDGMVVTAYYTDNTTETITGYTCSTDTVNYNSTGKVTIEISYGGKTTSVTVNVIPKLTGITVTVPKTEYVENQTFDKTGMTVTATYSDGKSYDVTNSVNVTPSGALKPSNDVVVVSYVDANKQTASANVSIHVVALAVDRIDVTTPPTKTSYIEEQTFDPTGMVVTATYNDGTTAAVTDYDYSPKTLTKGTTVVTISFRDKTTTVGVTVREKVLESIAVDASKAKTTYVVGQTFSADNLVVTATYDNRTTATVTGYEVSTPDMTKAGKQTVTVTYQGKTATYEIEISAKALTGIALDLNKVTRSFYVDDEFSAKGLVVYALYNDDTSVQVSGYEVTVPDMKTAGSKTVYVSYTEGSVTKTAAYDIYVSEKSTAKTYTITVIAGKNGSVYGSTIVPEGEDATFRFFPDEGYQVADVVVNGKSVGAVSSYTFKNVRADATLTVTFAKASSLPFYDVAESAWYYDSVVFVYNNGLMEGVSSTRFAPTADFSRAMIAQVLYNLEGRPAVSRGKTFTDVSASAWYADAVAWVTENGIFLGFGDGTFAPNTSISREQMATVLYRYVVYKGYNVKSADSLDYFSDGKTVSAWAKEGVAWAVSNGILGGYTDGTLRPLGTASRAEVAKMLTVFMERIVG